MPDALSDLAHVFHALSAPTRLQLLSALGAAGDACVQELVCFTGRSQAAVSQHLAVLRTAGLVEVRRDGKHRRYRATLPPSLRGYIDEVLRGRAAPTPS